MYAFALDKNNQRLDEPSVLATVAMWFELPEAAHAEEMITRLADADHETDWGMRIISSHSKLYTPPDIITDRVALFTGWRRWRISLPSRIARVLESSRERYAHAGWIARSRHGSFVRRLLPVLLHQFAAPDRSAAML